MAPGAERILLHPRLTPNTPINVWAAVSPSGYAFTHDLTLQYRLRGAKRSTSTNPIDPALPALAEVMGRDLAMHKFSASD